MASCIKSAQWLIFRLTILCLAIQLSFAWAGQNIVTAPVASGFPIPSTSDFAFLQPQFDRIGDETSIPSGAITAFAQDARGMIWIGTQLGLVVYDGYHFRPFTHSANDPTSLAGNFVSALWAAKDGRIWVGSVSDGLSVFDPATERFERRKHDPKQPSSLSAGRISALIGDKQGGIWIATSNGLDYLPPGNQNSKSPHFTHYRHDPANLNSLLNNQVNSLLVDRQGRLWVGSASGLQRLSQDRKGFERIAGSNPPNAALFEPLTPGDSGPEMIDIQTLFEAQDGKLWLGTSKRGAAWLAANTVTSPTLDAPELHWLALSKITPPQTTPPQAGSASANANIETLSHPWVTCFAQVRSDQIWLGTNGGGINIVAAADGQILQHLRHDPALVGSLALDAVRALFLDHAKLLWVGNWSAGLQRYNSNNTMLRLLRHGQKLPTGLSHPDVRSVLELDDGRILFGSSGNGIDIFDRERGLVGGYRVGQLGGLPDATVRAMIKTQDGALWAGTQAGAVRLLPGSTAWQAVPGLPGQQVRRFLQSRNGDLWVATDRGVARWNGVNPPQFEAVPDENGKPMQSLSLTLAEDRQGRIWIGSENGLWVMLPGAKGLRGIHPEPGRKNSLISNFVASLLVDSRDRLWVSTDKGIERMLPWNGKAAEFEHISALIGQNESALNGNLQEDKAGMIWSHAAVIDPEKMQIMMNLTKADGLDFSSIWLGAYTQTRDGLLLYGSTKGVAIFNPTLVQVWRYQPPLIVTELKINGHLTPLGALALPQGVAGSAPPSLTLNPGQRNFVLEFSALDFTAPEKNRYQYRLIGYENDWIDADSGHHNVAYGNLWPGLYTLQVRGSNRNGEWSQHELAIPINVLPYWYQTWWFWFFGLVVLFGTGFGVYRLRVASLKAQARANAFGLQKLLDARTADILNLGEIGKELTSTLDIEQTFERFYQQVRARMDVRRFSIVVYEEATKEVNFAYLLENEERLSIANRDMEHQTCPAVWCVRERRELIAGNSAELVQFLGFQQVPDDYLGMETVVYLPLVVEQRVIGCLSVQSVQCNAYDKNQLDFLRVLSSYTAIALSNSISHDSLARAHKHLQETQQQMVLQEKMAGLGTLTAGVAHEINNPINFVHVAAQIQRTEIAEFQKFVAGLIDDDESSAVILAFNERFKKMEDNVAIMLNGTERVKNIVKDMRSFTRLAEAEMKSVRLSECVNSTLNLVRTVWLEKVEFITELTDDPEIECWPALLNQVFMNLLINGCQAIAQKQQANQTLIPGKLCIRLKLNPENDTIDVIFEDNGVGIDEETQKRILEPFYTTKEVGDGVGLGLSIAFGIIQKHGGKLTFTSSAGVGSCFTVSLPRQKTQG